MKTRPQATTRIGLFLPYYHPPPVIPMPVISKVAHDPYTKPPKHVDGILYTNWKSLPFEVRKAYTEKPDDSPTDEETQAPEPFDNARNKRKATSDLDSDLEVIMNEHTFVEDHSPSISCFNSQILLPQRKKTITVIMSTRTEVLDRNIKAPSATRRGKSDSVVPDDVLRIKSFLSTKHNQLSPREHKLKKLLQELVRDFFKEIIGIVTTHKRTKPEVPLPGPHNANTVARLSFSSEPFLDPRFDQDVTHPANKLIFNKTVDLAVQSLNEFPPDIVLEMYEDIPVNRDLLSHLSILLRKKSIPTAYNSCPPHDPDWREEKLKCPQYSEYVSMWPTDGNNPPGIGLYQQFVPKDTLDDVVVDDDDGYEGEMEDA
ncbi:hypothetical protein JB92DRAFT_3146097 [Gautieria morchelliformis]|nr:hypothetical protein JB92DRAFT_3146097 [Gautieria morchelliformis]